MVTKLTESTVTLGNRSEPFKATLYTVSSVCRKCFPKVRPKHILASWAW